MAFDVVERDLDRFLVDEAKKAALADFIENEMIRYKDEAEDKFRIISNRKHAENIAATIAFGYREELPEAINIIEALDLDEKHIAALLWDRPKMRKIIEKEKQEELEDWLYASINY